jgi:long-chain acyl-CoA synthetase
MISITEYSDIRTRPWYKNYPNEIQEALETYQLPEIPLSRILESSAKYYSKSTALVYEPENLILTYQDLYKLCRRFSAGLVDRFNVKKGDRIAICARNYPEFLIAQYGIFLIGATYMACNPILIKNELAHQLKDSECKLAIISDDKLVVFQEIIKDRETELENVVVFSRDEELKPGLLAETNRSLIPPFFHFADIFLDRSVQTPEIDPKEDLAAVIYTAGTTSKPKGVRISHYNVVSSCISYYSVYTGVFPDLDSEGLLKSKNLHQDLTSEWEFPMRYGIDSALAATPWTHMMGFIAHLHCPIMAGITIFPMPVFEIEQSLEMIRRWKISFAGGAPQMMSMMLSRPDIDEIDLTSIRVWTTGGAPCPVAVGTRFEEKIGGIISEGYSLTEATMGSTKNISGRTGKRKWGSIGLPLPFTDVKIVDLDTRTTEMPTDEEGELVHNGPQVARGYLNRPEESAESFEDGWVFTGDIAKMDKDGFFYITGRKKDIIIYKGYNIAPRELEEILYLHPDIFQCAVVGKKDPLVGEIPVAFVSLKTDASSVSDEIMAFVNAKVAGYKKIREVRIMDQIPVSSAGKVLHKELRALINPIAALG